MIKYYGKHGQGILCTKMGAKNNPNAPEFTCPISQTKPKSFGFQWIKASLGVRSPWLLDKFYNSNHSCQQTFENKKFVDTQQCFALSLQVNFPAKNFNFHWRWLGRIQAIILNLFYVICTYIYFNPFWLLEYYFNFLNLDLIWLMLLKPMKRKLVINGSLIILLKCLFVEPKFGGPQR